jgi:hypothetical protein
MSEFDRFDIVEAWYIWAVEAGEYHVVSRLQDLGFRARPFLVDPDDLTENGRLIYDNLVTGAEERLAERWPAPDADGRIAGFGWWACLCPKEFSYQTGQPEGTVGWRKAAVA